MTPDGGADLEAIREALAKATAGPWRHGSVGGLCLLAHLHRGKGCEYRTKWSEGGGSIYAGAPEEDELSPGDFDRYVVAGMWGYDSGGVQHEADAHLIALLRNAAPELLALVDAQAERIASLEAGLRPFAEAGRDLDALVPRSRWFSASSTMQSDLRAAARLLEDRT